MNAEPKSVEAELATRQGAESCQPSPPLPTPAPTPAPTPIYSCLWIRLSFCYLDSIQPWEPSHMPLCAYCHCVTGLTSDKALLLCSRTIQGTARPRQFGKVWLGVLSWAPPHLNITPDPACHT